MDIITTKDKYNKFEVVLNSFFHSDYYVYLMAALTLLGWLLNTQYVLYFMLFSTSVMFITCKNTTPFVILHWFFLFSYREGVFGLDFSTWKMLFPILLVVSIIINIIRFKPDFKGVLSLKSIKAVTLSMFLLIIPMSLGGIAVADRHVVVVLQVSALFVGLALGFAYFMAMSRKHIEDKDSVLKLIIKVMFVTGIICSLQIIISLLQAGSLEAIRTVLERKGIYVGWGGANHVGALLGLCLPASFYYMIKSKKLGFVFVIVAFLQFCILILTRSRGAILFTTIALPLLFVYVIIKSDKRLSLGIAAVALVSGTLALMFTFRGTLMEMVKMLLDKGFDDSGRMSLYKEGWGLFKQYPIFGGGWDYKVPRDEVGFSPLPFHSMLIQVIACSGIVGLLFYSYYYWARYSTFFKRIRPETIIVLAGMLILEGYGMVDPISFFPIPFFIMLLTMSYAAEQAMPHDVGRPILFVKQPWRQFCRTKKAKHKE